MEMKTINFFFGTAFITVLAFIIFACGIGENNTTVAETNTYFTIKNESSFALDSVVWNGTDFGSIASGSYSKKAVVAGDGFIHFYIKSKELNARTCDFFHIEQQDDIVQSLADKITAIEKLSNVNSEQCYPLSTIEKAQAPKTGKVNITDISNASANINSMVENAGNPKYIEKGVCYSKEFDDVNFNCKIVEGTEFKMSLEELTENQKYFVRAYIDNGQHQRQYSDISSFIAGNPESSSNNVSEENSSSSSNGDCKLAPLTTEATADGTVLKGASLASKLSWLGRNAVSHNTYIIEACTDESVNPYTFYYSGAVDITVILRGDGANRTLKLNSNNSMFTVKENVTLILDRNITIQGHSQNDKCLVYGDGGILKMNDFATIKDNDNCGVYLNGGTFTMTGGTILGNRASGVYLSSGTFAMSGGTISSNSASKGGGVNAQYGTFKMTGGTISSNRASEGGGVYSSSHAFAMQGGTITGNTASSYGGGVYGNISKTGGTITGYNSDQANGNKVADASGTIARRGHSVYYSASLRKESTAGENDDLSSSNKIGAWDNE
ncbi:hypothetical protein AGMMS49938_00600 [Fibrobacterales bacterium]|nr:hypothetical protein AGMMS49938_00600 [Fibrobacterales bacterium]